MIEYKDINLNYGDKTILNQFSCKIEKGEKVLFRGKSGSGKTTLLKLLLGFEKNYTGSIILDGIDVNEKNIWNIRKKITYIPQTLDMGEGSIKSWLESLFSMKSLKHIKIDDKRVNVVFDNLELSQDMLIKNMDELSGGEKQRAAIAAALLTERKIILMDEATSALDHTMKEKVMKIFLENKEFTVLAISHDTIWHNSGLKIIEIGG